MLAKKDIIPAGRHGVPAFFPPFFFFLSLADRLPNRDGLPTLLSPPDSATPAENSWPTVVSPPFSPPLPFPFFFPPLHRWDEPRSPFFFFPLLQSHPSTHDAFAFPSLPFFFFPLFSSPCPSTGRPHSARANGTHTFFPPSLRRGHEEGAWAARFPSFLPPLSFPPAVGVQDGASIAASKHGTSFGFPPPPLFPPHLQVFFFFFFLRGAVKPFSPLLRQTPRIDVPFAPLPSPPVINSRGEKKKPKKISPSPPSFLFPLGSFPGIDLMEWVTFLFPRAARKEASKATAPTPFLSLPFFFFFR